MRPTVVATYYVESFYPLVDLTGSINQLLEARGVQFAGSDDVAEAVLANHEDAKLLELSKPAALIRVTGVSYAASGHVVHYTDARFPGDRCRLLLGGGSNEIDIRPHSYLP